MIELKAFIRETLVEICGGVREANQELLKSLAENKNLFELQPAGEKAMGSTVEFDLAVTTKSEETKGKGAKVNVYAVEAKIGKDAIASKESISRIKFKVMITRYFS